MFQLTQPYDHINRKFMPRLARLDAPGASHHIMIRGIERRNIFKDDKDRDSFIEKLRDVVEFDELKSYTESNYWG